MLKVERQDEGKRLTAETPRTPSGGREMRFTTVHRRLRTVTEDTEEDGVSLTQRREEEGEMCQTEGANGENKCGWHEKFDGLRRIRLKRGC